MEELKGRIVKIKDKELIILTARGEFAAVDKPHGAVRIGEEITGRVKPRKKPFSTAIMFSAAAVCLLASMFIFNFTANSAPMAYVSIDINPSIELTLGKDGKVLAAKAINDDGKKILDALTNQDDLNADSLVKAIVEKAAEMGYITAENKGEILISITPANTENTTADSAKQQTAGQDVADLEKQLKDAARDAIKTSHVPAEVETVIANSDDRREAQKLGLSTGKYVFMQKVADFTANNPEAAKELGLDAQKIAKLTPELLQTKSIAHVIKEDLGIKAPGQLISAIAEMNRGDSAAGMPAQQAIQAAKDNKALRDTGKGSEGKDEDKEEVKQGKHKDKGHGQSSGDIESENAATQDNHAVNNSNKNTATVRQGDADENADKDGGKNDRGDQVKKHEENRGKQDAKHGDRE